MGRWVKLVVGLLSLLLFGCGGPPLFLPPEDEGDPPIEECTALVVWDASNTYVGGAFLSPSDVDLFTIYVNASSGGGDSSMEMVIDVTDPNLIQWETTALTKGTHWFYMTVTTKLGATSIFSNVLSKLC